MKPDLSGASLRRRSSRRGGDSDSEQDPASVGTRHAGDAPSLQQSIVREVLMGSGVGALSPVVAAEMVLQQAGIDPGVLALDSNRTMKGLLGGGDQDSGPAPDPVVALDGITGGLPPAAKQRVGGTLGGSSAPVAGTTVQPTQMQNIGVNPSPDVDGTERDPNSLGEVFSSLANLSDGDLDNLLLESGQGFVQALGQSGILDLLGQMGMLPADEDQVEALAGAVPSDRLPTDPAEIAAKLEDHRGASEAGEAQPTENAAENEAARAEEAGAEEAAAVEGQAAPAPAPAPAPAAAPAAAAGPARAEAAAPTEADPAAEAGATTVASAPGTVAAAAPPTPAIRTAPIELPRQSSPRPAPAPSRAVQAGGGGPPARTAAPRPGPAPRTQIPQGAPPQMPTAPGSGGSPGYESPIPTDTGKQASPDAEEMDDAQQQDVNIDLRMDLEVPPELQGGGQEPPGHDCNVGQPQVQSNVGQGMMPENTYDPALGEAPAPSAGPSGDGLLSSGVDPNAAATPVAVNPATGTMSGHGAPSGGESVAPETMPELNPAAQQPMAQQPAFQSTAPPAPGAGPEMGAVDAGGGGGGGTLPQGSVANVSYSGGSGDHLPQPQAPDVPQDFASGGGQQAQQQMEQDARRMQTVGPAVQAQQQGEVAPKQQEGEQSIWDQILAFFSSLGLYDAQAANAEQQGQTRRQQAEQNTQQLVGDANLQQQAQLQQQAGLPVPAELQQRGQTYMQAVTAAEAAAVQTWSGGPQTQMPTGAQQAVDQGRAQVQALDGRAAAPDLQASVGAVQLPDHGLEPQSFDEIVDPSLQQLDASQIPQAPTAFPGGGGGGGGDAVGRIQSDVNGKVSAEVTAYQQQLIREQTERAQQGFESTVSDTASCYQGSVDRADEAIAQYEAADIQAEVAPFDQQAQQAFETAQGESGLALSEMDAGFVEHQASFDSTVVCAEGEFEGAMTAARGMHSGAVAGAGAAYDQSVARAQQELEVGHDEAMGTYQNTATAAVQGAEQTFARENATAQGAIAGHQAAFDGQYAQYEADAEGAGADARSQFQSSFQAEQARMQAATGQQIAATQGRIDSEMRTGQSQIDAHLRQGQSDAQRRMDQGQARAEAERNRAQAEADRKIDEAENAKDDRNIFEKIGDAIASAISAALDWIKARFEEAKNAIVNFLEQAREAALGILQAARDLALSVLDTVRGLVQSLISTLADALRAFVSAVAQFVSQLVEWAVQWILAQIRAITALITGLIEAFQQAVNLVVEGLVAAVALIDQDLATKLQGAADAFLERFNSVCDQAQASIEGASQELQSQIQAAGDTLKGAIESAEQSLLSRIDQAEAALHAGVDAVYQTAVDAVNAAYEVATDVVNTAFDLAQTAVVALIDTVYSAIESVAKELAAHIQEVFSVIGTVAEWVVQNVVAPLIEFLRDPWTALRQMWVDFWNGPWRDILLGVALIALATVVAVATGGLGLVAMVAITAAVTGAAAAVTYGAGEMAARRANVSLVEEGHQTWKGASVVDPKSGQLVPDPRDPNNAWYLDTLGSISRNPDGSMSYTDANGNLVTVTQDQLANDPSAVVAMMEQGLARDENGQLTGESTSDSLRGSAAIAADKGIEWTINGAVTAGTMGMGNYLTAAAQAGKMSMVTSTVLRTGGSAALQSTADLVSGPISDSVGEMIQDGKGFSEAWDQSWQHNSVGDVTKAWGTSFLSNVAGEVVSNKFSRLGNANQMSGVTRTLKDAGEGLTSSAANVVIQNASDVMFDGDPNTGWQTFFERTTSPDAVNQLVQGTVQNMLASRANDYATTQGERIRADIDRRLGTQGTQAFDRAVEAEGADPQTLRPVEEGAGQGVPVRPRTDEAPADVQTVRTPAPDADPLSVKADSDAVVPLGTPRDTTVATDGTPRPLEGQAAPLQGSTFTGDRSTGTTVAKRDLHDGLRAVRESTGMSSKEFKLVDAEDGSQTARLKVGDRDVSVKIEVVDPTHASLASQHGTAAAAYVDNGDGTYTVRVSAGIDPRHVSRALAHEIAEIRFVERKSVAPGSQPGMRGQGADTAQAGVMDRTTDPTGAMTAHDAGRMAEIATLLSDVDRLKPTKPDDQGSPRYRESMAELDLLLQQTGLGDNNLAGRERFRVLQAEAVAGNVPQGVVSRIQRHLEPHLAVDISATHARATEFARALFTGQDYSNVDGLLKAMRGMDEHTAKAFKDLVVEESGQSMEQVQAALKGRLHPSDYAEAMTHLKGDTYEGSVAALQNALRDKELATTGREMGADVDGDGPGLLSRWFFHTGSGVKAAVRRGNADEAGAVDLLASMKPEDRLRLVREQPDLLSRLGEKVGSDGPLRRQWDALSTGPKKNEATDAWALRGRAEYLIGHLEHQLQLEGGIVGRTMRKNREGALAELEHLRNDPDLYQQVLKSLKARTEKGGDPRKTLEDLLAKGLDGSSPRDREQLAVMRVKLDQADLDLQNRGLVRALREGDLPIANGAELSEVAALAQDPRFRKRVEDVLGASKVDQLVAYAGQRRALEHQERAHAVMAAVRDGRFDETYTLLADPTGTQLRRTIDDPNATPDDKQFAQWRLEQWQRDRSDLVRTLESVGGGAVDQLGRQLHGTLSRVGGKLSDVFGQGDPVRFREQVLPTLVSQGALPPHDHLYLALVGQGADNALVGSALRGRSPQEIQQVATDFRTTFGDRYGSLLRQFGGPGQEVDFLRAVLKSQTTGRGQHDALRLLHGDPTAVFDPTVKYADDATTAEHATRRLALERTILDESFAFEGKRATTTGMFKGSDPDSVAALRDRHRQLSEFMDKHAADLQKGLPGTWDTLRSLRQQYDAAALQNDAQRKRSAGNLTKIGTTVAGAGLAIGMPALGLPMLAGKLLAGGALTGGKLAAGHLLDPTRTRQQDIAEGVSGLVGTGLGAVLPGDMEGKITQGIATSGTKRGLEYGMDWRSSQRGAQLRRGLLMDSMQSIVTGGLGGGTKAVKDVLTGGSQDVGSAFVGQAVDQPVKPLEDAGKSGVEAVAGRVDGKRGGSVKPTDAAKRRRVAPKDLFSGGGG